MGKKTIILASFLGAFIQTGYTQVGIGTVSPHASSVLDVTSNTKGFLPPRVSSHTAVSNPAEGLIIYDESDNCLNVFNGGSWENLCGVSTSPPSNQNSVFSSNCDGAFDNISTFGNFAYYNGAAQGHGHPNSDFSFHLNADGTRLYQNHGFYFDTNATQVLNLDYGNRPLNMPSQVVALEQKMPGMQWANFGEIRSPFHHTPQYIYLLSKQGGLFGFNLFEPSSTTPKTWEYPGTSINNIIGPTDNDVKQDDALNRTDYLFNIDTFYAEGNNQSILFDELYTFVAVNPSSSYPLSYAVFTYNDQNQKFYSMGTQQAYSTLWHSKQTAQALQRTAPATQKESFMLNEATWLNDMMSHFGANFYKGDRIDQTFINRAEAYYIITDDGYINYIKSSSAIDRYYDPNGVQMKSIPHNNFYNVNASADIPILGEDGKLYRKSSIAPVGTTESINGRNYTINTYQLEPYITGNTILDNLDYKQITLSYTLTGANVHILTQDGKLYDAKLENGPTVYKEYTSLGLPPVKEIMGSEFDMIVKTTDNQIVYIVTNLTGSFANTLKYQLTGRDEFFGGTAIGIDGIPLNNYNDSPFRIMNACYGK